MKRNFVVVIGALAVSAAQGAAQSSQCSSSIAPEQNACNMAVDLFSYMAPQLGASIAGGNTTLGQGGSIPLCNVFAETYPRAEIILTGVEEPRALIHAPNESVDPREIASLALAEALFLGRYVN